jgi:chromate transporter
LLKKAFKKRTVIRQVRYFIFLKDVFWLALTTFGGPQAHLAHFHRILVDKRNYLDGPDLVELNSLCQLLPGPSSTQTLTAVGFRVGGPTLAYLTLLVWVLPSVLIMTTAGIVFSSIQEKEMSLQFTRFIQPIAVGFVSYAAYTISLKTIYTKTGVVLMVAAAIASYFFQTPYVFPIILLLSGALTALKYRKHPKEKKEAIKIDWSNFILWAGVLIVAAVIGRITGLPMNFFPATHLYNHCLALYLVLVLSWVLLVCARRVLEGRYWVHWFRRQVFFCRVHFLSFL